jgi:outer membrane lipoprotein-sorting protein
MKNILIQLFFVFLISNSFATEKANIINNLGNINNLYFKFEQNINGNTQNGECIIKYPKKIFCNYNLSNKKVLVSNGSSIVIKTKSSYYLYPIERTPLNLILDKEFLLKKIKSLEERIIEDKYINFKFYENENEISLFFNKETFDLIGWQTIDLYQNLRITYLSNINKNLKLKKNLFKLPKQN